MSDTPRVDTSTLAGIEQASYRPYDEAGQPYDPRVFKIGQRVPSRTPSRRLPGDGDRDPRPRLGEGGYDGPSWYQNRLRRGVTGVGTANQIPSSIPGETFYGRYADQYGVPGGPRPGDVDSYIRTNYPYMAAFLGNPEVGPILRKAALEGWDEGRLYGAVQATGWWRNTSAANRQWQALQAEDPAEASRLAGQTASNMQNRAASLGINMSPGQIQSLALQATANGWTDNQVVDELLRSLNWATVQAGDLTALVDTVKATGGAYLVDVSDETARSYAAAIASGEMSEAGVSSVMQRQAKARFGWMADEIDQGVTPSQYFMPVRDTIARELEMAPESVDMMNPRWMGLIETRDESGTTRAATLNEARLAARREPEWQATRGAGDLMSQAAAAIGNVFGRKAI